MIHNNRKPNVTNGVGRVLDPGSANQESKAQTKKRAASESQYVGRGAIPCEDFAMLARNTSGSGNSPLAVRLSEAEPRSSEPVVNVSVEVYNNQEAFRINGGRLRIPEVVKGEMGEKMYFWPELPYQNFSSLEELAKSLAAAPELHPAKLGPEGATTFDYRGAEITVSTTPGDHRFQIGDGPISSPHQVLTDDNGQPSFSWDDFPYQNFSSVKELAKQLVDYPQILERNMLVEDKVIELSHQGRIGRWTEDGAVAFQISGESRQAVLSPTVTTSADGRTEFVLRDFPHENFQDMASLVRRYIELNRFL